MFTLFLLTFFVLLAGFFLMAVGVLFARKPLQKKCGYDPEKDECSICHKKNLLFESPNTCNTSGECLSKKD